MRWLAACSSVCMMTRELTTPFQSRLRGPRPLPMPLWGPLVLSAQLNLASTGSRAWMMRNRLIRAAATLGRLRTPGRTHHESSTAIKHASS